MGDPISLFQNDELDPLLYDLVLESTVRRDDSALALIRLTILRPRGLQASSISVKSS